MMVIIDLYLACTALVLMLIEDAPLLLDSGLHESGPHEDEGRAPPEPVSSDASPPRS